MQQIQGVDKQHEISRSRLIRDTRPLVIRVLAGLGSPGGVAIAGMVLVLVAVIAPAMADLVLVLGLLYLLIPRKADIDMPFRMPAHSGVIDPKDIHPGTRKAQKARGIAFVGNRASDDAEFWEADGDVKRHWFILGSTGAGKTEALVSLCVNAMAWVSGFMYTDGKGDVTLFAKVWSLCRIFGREDDLLVMNFMTGNADTTRKRSDKLSNSYNPFLDGNASSKTQLLINLMDSGGDGKGADVWKGRAISFIASIMPALVDKRDFGGMLLHVGRIREYLPFLRLLELMRDPSLTPDNKTRINAFLLDVPGYKADKAEAQSNTFFEQYGYQQMQFTRILSSLADTYGHIFKTEQADIDMRDVVANRRILVNLLPALESSRPELANLGKIIVAGVKGMMGSNLGNRVEGTKREVLDARATNAPTPFPAIFDEHGYYLTEDTALMWAQGRSLGFWLVSAGQDLQAYFRTSKEETKAIIANCNTKAVGKLEDPTETFEMIEALGGEALISTVGDYDLDVDGVAGGYLEGRSVKIDRVKRITLQDLQRQIEGEVHILMSGDIVRARMFYADPPAAERYQLNHFIKVLPPSQDAAEALRVNTRALIDSLHDPESRFGDQRPADRYFAYVGDLLQRPHVLNFKAKRQGAELGVCLLMGFVESPEPAREAQGTGGGLQHRYSVVDGIEDEDRRGREDAIGDGPADHDPDDVQFDASELAASNVFQSVPVGAAAGEDALYASLARAASPVVDVALAVQMSSLFAPAPGTETGPLSAVETQANLIGLGEALGGDRVSATQCANTMIAEAAAATSYPVPPTPPDSNAELMQSAMERLESLVDQAGSDR